MYGVILHYACLGTISPLIPVAFVGFEDSLLELLGLFLNIKIRLVRGRLVGVSLGVCRLHLVWCGRVGPVAECALYIRGLSAPADSGFIGISGAQTHLYLVVFLFPFGLLIRLARDNLGWSQARAFLLFWEILEKPL